MNDILYRQVMNDELHDEWWIRMTEETKIIEDLTQTPVMYNELHFEWWKTWWMMNNNKD